MSNALYDHICRLVPGFKDQVKDVLPYFQKKIFTKGENIIIEEESVDSYFFVMKGCLNMYYTDEDSKETTIHFALENWWITDYLSFLGYPKARFGARCLEDTELMTIHKSDFDGLLQRFPFMGVYFNSIHMKAYGASLLRIKNFATTSKKDFYTFFKNTYPEFFLRVPPPILASYMGISGEEFDFFNEPIRS